MNKNQLEWEFGGIRVLVIDDKDEEIDLVRGILEEFGEFEVIGLVNPLMVSSSFKGIMPDVIMLDMQMPGRNGLQVLSDLSAEGVHEAFVPILFFTADDSIELRNRALSLGASDFIAKPFDAIELLLRVRNFARLRHVQVSLREQNLALESTVFERTTDLEVAREEAIAVLARASEFRDDMTGEHAKRVGETSAQIAKCMGLPGPQVDLIRQAAPLHDVGKIGIVDAILLKPDKLTNDEFEVMKRHSAIGKQIIGSVRSPLLQMASAIAEYHHERWDGMGYPHGLAANAIPIEARIVAVADVFDALTHDRPYKRAWDQVQALDEVRYQSGKQFDPAVVQAFISLR